MEITTRELVTLTSLVASLTAHGQKISALVPGNKSSYVTNCADQLGDIVNSIKERAGITA